jgi:tetratricopeptide (TPR) repeat protein
MGNLAVLEVECGRWEDAEKRFHQALAWLAHSADDRLYGITLGNYGMFCLERRSVNLAVSKLAEARARLAAAGDLRSEAIATGRLGAAQALSGELEAALQSLQRAKRLAARRDILARQAIDIQFVFYELGCARIELAQGTAHTAAELLQRAEMRRDTALSPISLRGGTAAQKSDDVRAALRIAEPIFAELRHLLHL